MGTTRMAGIGESKIRPSFDEFRRPHRVWEVLTAGDRDTMSASVEPRSAWVRRRSGEVSSFMIARDREIERDRRNTAILRLEKKRERRQGL